MCKQDVDMLTKEKGHNMQARCRYVNKGKGDKMLARCRYVNKGKGG